MISASPRLNLHLWSNDEDPLARAQFTADHQSLDAALVRDTFGSTLAARPAPAAVPRGTWWSATDTATTWRSDGSTWTQVTTPEQPITALLPEALTYAQGGAPGASPDAVRADHAHAMPGHDIADHYVIAASAFGAATTHLNLAGYALTALGTPTAGTDAATKAYVDAAIDTI